MMLRNSFFTSLFPSLLLVITVAPAQAQSPPAPASFPSIHLAHHEEESALLSDYLWRHFYHRLGNGLTLFNKEYLLFADMWLGEACPRGESRSIQSIHRQHLLAMQIDPEGYVSTHQHFSHAHDWGWPFPMWTQADHRVEKIKGKTAGWHFQRLEEIPGWVGDTLRHWKDPTWYGKAAADSFTLENARSEGIENKAWKITATAASPALLSPEGISIQADNAPFLQLRWRRSRPPKSHTLPYIEWKREGDSAFSPERRVFFPLEKTPLSPENFYHSHITMHTHPLWKGVIRQMRVNLAPGESDLSLFIDSFFTVYDTRHTINNPIFILASYYYFVWTGDLDFLRQNINRMRSALRYQQTVLGGLEHKHIRNTWPGHDALPGWSKDASGKLTLHNGHGIGSNYWDLMPFGWDDFYATYQYYAATQTMALLETAITAHPQWGLPQGALRLDPAFLKKHAQEVKENANKRFWNATDGRFYASIDKSGKAHDYGYTFLNLDAIWYDIASKEHGQSIMDWIGGRRLIATDDSTGSDIYRWRFGPRASTKRNLEWYAQGWIHPEAIPWGGQVQDGGAVLGFSFYDLWARLHYEGPDNAWTRLSEILSWDKEVQQAGGYRAYYADGKQGSTLQGGGTAGGLGIDAEFYESSLLPAIVPYGFLGLSPEPDRLKISPALPTSIPAIQLRNLRYWGVLMDISVTGKNITIDLKTKPLRPLRIETETSWTSSGEGACEKCISLCDSGTYQWNKR